MPPDPEMLVKWADGGHRSDQGVDGEDGVATRSENADVDESDGGGACSSPPFLKREVAGGAGTPLTRDPEESGASKVLAHHQPETDIVQPSHLVKAACMQAYRMLHVGPLRCVQVGLEGCTAGIRRQLCRGARVWCA